MIPPSSSSPRLTPRPVDVPAWIAIALGELGVLEDTRPGRTTARIAEYHAVTRGGIAPDDVPWCSAFACWCVEAAGIVSTRSKAASSWLAWGEPAPAAECGTIVVFGKLDPDAAGTGHVALALGASADRVYVVGGNQANAVTIAARPRASVRALRRPTAAMLASTSSASSTPA